MRCLQTKRVVIAGVVLTDVQRGSPAAEAGLRPGDVILKVGTRRVNDADAFWRALSRHDLEEGVRLLIRRGDLNLFVVLKAPTE